jgi:uncharacterized protein (DUF1800 family)
MDDTRSEIAHLLRRAGFGARPDELDAAVAEGYRATVDSLLAGLTGPDEAGDRLAPPRLSLSQQPVAAGQDPVARMAANRQRQMAQTQEYQALQTWWLDRMIVTSTPLREKLTLLWHGHFATGFEKVRNAGLMYRQNQLLRTRGAGNFEALTQAVAKDAAMMLWLDTQTDVAGHPNENFARELMELFTLGPIVAELADGYHRDLDVTNLLRAIFLPFSAPSSPRRPPGPASPSSRSNTWSAWPGRSVSTRPARRPERLRAVGRQPRRSCSRCCASWPRSRSTRPTWEGGPKTDIG